MSALPALRIAGIGAWATGMPGWAVMAACARGEAEPDPAAPRRPQPDLLPANERRRAPDSVLLALHAAQAACADADCDPKSLASIFASTHGDLAITDYMCATLRDAPAEMSPTKFHNSVHNAAAGYWTIGTGCHRPATALSAYDTTFAQALLEATLQLATQESRVLLVAYDGPAPGPLAAISSSAGLLGLAVVLERADTSARDVGPTLQLSLHDRTASAEAPTTTPGPLSRLLADNAMAPLLPFAEALACGLSGCRLDAGPQQSLDVRITP